MNFLKKAICAVAIATLLFAGSSCSGPSGDTQQSDNQDITIDTSQVEPGSRTLRIYSSLDPSETKIYFNEYEKLSGVKIQWVRMSSGAVFARLSAEKSNPAMGLWFGGSSTDFISAAEEGLLDSYRPNVDFELSPQAHDPQWQWTGFYFGAIGFASNIERLKRIGADAPQSWNDLLKPDFKGEIGMAYPYTSGTSYTVLSTIIQMMGEEKGFDYIKKLDANIHHYNKSGSSCVTQVGLGEIAVGIAFSHDILKKGPSRGYPVQLTFPQEGTGYEIGGMALVKNGPDRAEAEKFMDWVLSKEAQDLMKNWFRIPLNPNADVVDGAVTADGVNLIEDDAVWGGKNKGRLVEKWRLVTSR